MNPFRTPASAVEETKADPFPAKKAPPTEAEVRADRVRRLKVAAAAITGSAWEIRSNAENIVTKRYGDGRYDTKLEELESKVDEAIAVMELAIAQWRGARP